MTTCSLSPHAHVPAEVGTAQEEERSRTEADLEAILDSWSNTGRLSLPGSELITNQLVRLLEYLAADSFLAQPARRALSHVYIAADGTDRIGPDSISSATHARIVSALCRSKMKECSGSQPAQSAETDFLSLRTLHLALSRCSELERDARAPLEGYLMLCSVSSMQSLRVQAKDCAKLASSLVQSEALSALAEEQSDQAQWLAMTFEAEGLQLGLQACYKLQRCLALGLFGVTNFKNEVEAADVSSSSISARSHVLTIPMQFNEWERAARLLLNAGHALPATDSKELLTNLTDLLGGSHKCQGSGVRVKF
jgi:hypothetical protein